MNQDFNEMLIKQAEGGFLSEISHYILDTPASKRVRPNFLRICGEMAQLDYEKIQTLACAVELIHTASLVHDDVIDENDIRRAQPSVNSKFGNKIAVLAGDQLLSRAMIILSSSDNCENNLKAAANTISMMSDAAAMEIAYDNNRLSYEQLSLIIDGKTGSLFALCGSLVGIAVNNDKYMKEMSLIGSMIGRIFQLKDDIKDIDEDNKNNIQTIPINFGIDKALEEIELSYSKIMDTIKKSDYDKTAADKLIKIINKIIQKDI